eukprot:TRINITY_DN20392_c0_g1_i1.p1 TRINITY_DN20392_c0_g1~~TRINITY_DN20392_c0_g1_i1.p1  ORF type:complete len:382 (+),score=129.00 TRINITY_DN20392_c0_g1_i1:116-1147(+)
MTEAAGTGAEAKDGKKVMLLHGGWMGEQGTCSGDLWCYDPATKAFELVHVEGVKPAARCAHVLAYTKGVCVLFGGEDSDHVLLNDTWELVLGETGAWEWTKKENANPPSARRGSAFTAIGDGRFLLHGGMDGERCGDLWMYDPAQGVWSEVKAGGKLPAPRDGHGMAFEPKRNAVHLFGGFDVSDTRDRFTLFFDTAANPANDDGALVGGAEEKPAAAGTSCDWVAEPSTPSDPCPRNGHSVAVFAEPNNMLVVTLGFHGGAPHPECSEIHELPFADPSAWVVRKFSDAGGECLPLAPRRLHTTAVVEGKMVIFGGWDGTHYLKNVLELDFAKAEGGAPGKKK